MFINSQFNQDISNWTPYILEEIQSVFFKSKCPVPYWANYSIIEERKKAINAYKLNRKLNKELKKNKVLVKI